MDTVQNGKPIARKARLVVKEVNGEVLVYDLDREKAHCLNDTAARVWKYCDGSRDVPAIAGVLESDLGASVDEQLVWCALARLEKSNLLEEPVVPAAVMSQVSRRDAIRTLGLASLVAIPVVASIVVPTPAQAQSFPGGIGGPK